MIEIKEKTICSGCSACYNACPIDALNMETDEQGFLYPKVIKEKCVNCRKCELVCPILNPIKEINTNQKAFLLQHKNQRILKESSSGGAFTAIATIVILSGGVVFGAAYDQAFNVKHKYVETVEDLSIFRNSKYVQSEIGKAFSQVKAFLNSGRRVCFSGTPCQIEGLLNYLGKKNDNLVLVDVVCHAVPSPLVWKTYLEILKERGFKNIYNLRFRDKEKYGYLYSQFSIKSKENNEFQGIETNEMLRAFFSEICNRPSCYDCRFKKRYRRSDITIWDCFDLEEFSKSKMFDQNKGISRVLVHTEVGKSIISKVSDTCLLEEIIAENALHYDAKEMVESVKKNKKYDDFWSSFAINPKETLLSYFPVTHKSKIESSIRRLSIKLGVYQLVRKMYKKVFGNRQR